MVFTGEQYYNINRIMLTTIGLWPYQKQSILHTVFFFSVFISFILFQLTVFLTAKHDFGFITNMLSNIFPSIGYFLFYNCYYFNIKKVSKIRGFICTIFSHNARISYFRERRGFTKQGFFEWQVKQLLEQIEADWNTVDDSELKILQKYAIKSRLISLILVSMVIFGMSLLIIIEMLPIILDVVVPMNESRPRKIKVMFEMFLDQQQYFYIYLIHEIVVVMASFSTVVAIGTLLFAILRHCCATYKIASTLIGSLVTKHTLEIPSKQRTREMCRRITRAVCLHRKTIQFIKFLLNIVNKWFFVIMGIAVLSLSCNLLRFLTAVIVLKELSEAIICGGMVFAHFVILFLANFIGQTIIDHSTEMFMNTYNTAWYLAPLPIQKLLLFVMQNTLKTNTLMIGGIFIASLEGFSTVINVKYINNVTKLVS
ncbi:uncharacterized protein LOC116845931 [Odontomachus brunneus]|uniref:uncharacterized protein LOC116845931 n=1 Tax=Odontomachus brunneus TaxID=486640 RepID=UPI0013F285DA|nr:uncharacterized protein LOC116845931 [Odontomachus brunneus]